jgi:DNA-binding MarR family transcriptional regulator
MNLQENNIVENDISSQQCAALLMEVVPLVMGTIRREMRRHRAADLSVPQFRALNFVRRNPGTSLSQVAEHLDLTLPSVSKMIDGLQERKLLTREIDATNRRKMILNLTEEGNNTLYHTRQATMLYLGDILDNLSHEARLTLATSIETLRPLFSSEVITEFNFSEQGVVIN